MASGTLKTLMSCPIIHWVLQQSILLTPECHNPASATYRSLYFSIYTKLCTESSSHIPARSPENLANCDSVSLGWYLGICISNRCSKRCNTTIDWNLELRSFSIWTICLFLSKTPWAYMLRSNVMEREGNPGWRTKNIFKKERRTLRGIYSTTTRPPEMDHPCNVTIKGGVTGLRK
jgi:hypothetical protein